MEQSRHAIKLLIEGTLKVKEAPQVPEHLLGVVKETRRLQAFEILPAERGEGGALPAEAIQAGPDDVLELELEGGYRIWMSVEEYRRALAPPDQLRRGRETDSLPGTVRVGAEFPGGDRERGVAKWVVKGLKFIGIDVAAGAARFIAGKIDDKDGLNGLYSLALSGDRPALTSPVFPPGSEPLLVFIHGTMSSTEGSFGGLWSERQDLLGRLRQMYGGRAYAYEHKTFGESPVENAIALASALPDGAVLHLVSHSRGGMIGELLCRSQRCGADGSEAAPFEKEDFDLFAGTEQARLRQLDVMLSQKRLTIPRFVRVACPARGTTIASGRLDRWLSVIRNGLSHLVEVSWVGDIGWLIASIIKERTNPEVMPGIRAMMPDSPTVALLNRHQVTVKADLRVIAGDYEGGGTLGLLGDWGVEQFFDGLNDLVVNTPSMYGGAGRLPGPGWYFYAEGPHAYHFNYFKNAATASRFADALALEDPASAGFKPISEAPGKDDPIARGIVIDFFAEGAGEKLEAREPSPSGAKPLLVLVPGIMGTHLKAGDRVWVALGALASGRFQKLAIDNREVATDGLVKMAYGDFAEYFADSHEVLPFPYDWRLSLRSEGKRLARFMDQVLTSAATNNRPVRIVAHSMGGLLVRMAAVLGPGDGGTGWWPSFSGRFGSRLVMAGTPNGGSWMVPLALTGRADIVRSIATVDLRHDSEDIVRITREFEGFLEMLPVREGNADALDPGSWAQWRVAGEEWEPPGAATLSMVRQRRQLLEQFDFQGSEGVLRYLAGRADHTPTAPEIRDGKLRFGSSPEGDGRVLWSTGIPWPRQEREGRVWFLDAAHGDLLDTEAAFKGIGEILEHGGTTLLSPVPALKSPPRGIEENPWERGAPFYPDQAMLVRAALGSSPGRERRAARGAGGVLRVSVCHGDLASARHPVAVGHYLGDAITGGEAALDRRLDSILSRRHRLGIYPGPDGSSEVFFNEAGDWGAIVIGLGHVGDLSAKKLSESFARVLLEFATSSSKCVSAAGGFSISSLLIGSGAGWGLGVRESVRALIEGARLANTMLREIDGGRTFLQELELLELYEDRALQALHAVRDLSRFGVFSGIDLQSALRSDHGGRCRALSDEAGAWWRRMKVELSDDALKYTVITGLARTEETMLPTQRSLVESLIAEAIRKPGVQPRDMAAIYNLLTPNSLKERAPDEGDLLMMVDEGAAGYPWEMMQMGDAERREALALRAGFLRQLVLPSYRERVAYSVGTRVLVVADPELPKGAPFPDLPGAQGEGRAVVDELGKRGFSAEACIRCKPRQILGALFDGEYRILHLAGHGVHRFEKRRRREDCSFESRFVTGMVLDWKPDQGQGAEPVLLTAAEVRQLRRVPELVFINCCFLGLPGPEEERSERLIRLTEPSLFAASIAKEFIAMGVRAVIAAGWAVNDAAAKAFAGHFYGAMLQGSSFGAAVHGARLEAHKAADSSNTWAAYQCYGDPDYRLLETDGKERAKFFLSPREAICEIRGLAGAPRDASGLPLAPEKLRGQLAQIISVLPHGWFTGNGELREAVGDVFADLGDYRSAVEHYQAAAAAGGSCSVRVLERIFNLEVRELERDVAAGTRTVRQAESRILESIENFRDRTLSALGATPERFALIGSAYKGLLMMNVEQGTKPAARKVENWLAELRDWYRKGAVIQGEIDPYNALNWLAAEIVYLYRRPGQHKGEAQLRDEIVKVLEKGKKLQAENPSFWNGVFPVDAKLCLWLLEQLEPPEAGQARPGVAALIEEYRDLIRRYGSAREAESVLQQFKFLLKALPEKAGDAVRAGLEALLAKVPEAAPDREK